MGKVVVGHFRTLRLDGSKSCPAGVVAASLLGADPSWPHLGTPSPPRDCCCPRLLIFPIVQCHARMVYLPMAYLYGNKCTCKENDLIRELREEIYVEPYSSINWPAQRDFCNKIDRYVINLLKIFPNMNILYQICPAIYHPQTRQLPFKGLREIPFKGFEEKVYRRNSRSYPI